MLSFYAAIHLVISDLQGILKAPLRFLDDSIAFESIMFGLPIIVDNTNAWIHRLYPKKIPTTSSSYVLVLYHPRFDSALTGHPCTPDEASR